MKKVSFLVLLAVLYLGIGLILSCSGKDDDDNDDDGQEADDDDEGLADGYHPGLGYVAADPESDLKLIFPDVAALLGKSVPKSASDDVYDPNSNLNHDHPTSVQSCQIIAEKTGQNWELTTVDDLRLWLRGCPATVWGGQCGVYNDCMVSSCRDESCNDGCWAGAGPHPEGYYVIDDFPVGAGSGFYWSNTTFFDDDPTYDGWYWNVSFEWANIGYTRPEWNLEMRVACALH